ncbi:hypothetical protein JCM10212_005138 [Sporobolomyces blumeae]
MANHPSSFSRAVFHSKGSELTLDDHISQYKLIDDDQQKFPVCPGQVVVGEIVEVNEGGGFKEGERVAAILRNGALSEYVVAETTQLVKVDENADAAELCVLAFNGTRLAASFKNNVFEKDDLVCVHGEKGYARLAVEIVTKLFEHENLCLCTSDKTGSPKEYGVPQERFFLTNQGGIGKSLRKFGGARVVICESLPRSAPETSFADSVRALAGTAIPNKHLDDLFAGCLDDARVVLLVLGDRALSIPTGEFVQRGLSVNGAPYASHEVTNDVLERKGDLKVQVSRFPFTKKGVVDAWKAMEAGQWDAPVVVFGATH